MKNRINIWILTSRSNQPSVSLLFPLRLTPTCVAYHKYFSRSRFSGRDQTWFFFFLRKKTVCKMISCKSAVFRLFISWISELLKQSFSSQFPWGSFQTAAFILPVTTRFFFMCQHRIPERLKSKSARPVDGLLLRLPLLVKQEAAFCFASITSGWLLVYGPLECFLFAPLYLVCLSASRLPPGVTTGSFKKNIFGISLNKDEGDSCLQSRNKHERKDEGE